MKVSFVKQDQWIGHYYDSYFHYVCLIPCVVFMWRRKGIKKASVDLDHCMVCKSEVYRYSRLYRNGGTICKWCMEIEDKMCSHLHTEPASPHKGRDCVRCVRCGAVQYRVNM